MSKSANPKRRAVRKKNVGMSRQQLVVVEAAPANRRIARRTYRSYSKAEKKPGAISNAGSAIGGGLGSAFGPVGTGIGSFLGGKLGHLIETVTGFGDYKVDQNSILTGGMSPPQVVNSINNGGFIIRHREYLGDILGTIAFTNQSFLIQPGLNVSFPWLSQIANSFEQYRLRGVLFEFNSTSSDAVLSTATSSALGSVIMMTDYDVADDPPTSKRQMLNAEFSCSTKPSKSAIHPIECKKQLSAQSILYTRSVEAVPVGFDQRLYDFGRFNIATEGMQANGGSVGELWITYEIELLKPQYSVTALADHYTMDTVTAARPFGTITGSNIGRGGTIGGLMSGDGLSYSFPPMYSEGLFLVSYNIYGGGVISVSFPNSFVYNNCVSFAFMSAGTVAELDAPEPPTALANHNTAICTWVVRITAQEASFTIPGTGVYPNVPNTGDLFVSRLPDSMLENFSVP